MRTAGPGSPGRGPRLYQPTWSGSGTCMAPSARSPIPTMPALTPMLGMVMVIGPMGRAGRGWGWWSRRPMATSSHPIHNNSPTESSAGTARPWGGRSRLVGRVMVSPAPGDGLAEPEPDGQSDEEQAGRWQHHHGVEAALAGAVGGAALAGVDPVGQLGVVAVGGLVVAAGGLAVGGQDPEAGLADAGVVDVDAADDSEPGRADGVLAGQGVGGGDLAVFYGQVRLDWLGPAGHGQAIAPAVIEPDVDPLALPDLGGDLHRGAPAGRLGGDPDGDRGRRGVHAEGGEADDEVWPTVVADHCEATQASRDVVADAVSAGVPAVAADVLRDQPSGQAVGIPLVDLVEEPAGGTGSRTATQVGTDGHGGARATSPRGDRHRQRRGPHNRRTRGRGSGRGRTWGRARILRRIRVLGRARILGRTRRLGLGRIGLSDAHLLRLGVTVLSVGGAAQAHRREQGADREDACEFRHDGLPLVCRRPAGRATRYVSGPQRAGRIDFSKLLWCTAIWSRSSFGAAGALVLPVGGRDNARRR